MTQERNGGSLLDERHRDDLEENNKTTGDKTE